MNIRGLVLRHKQKVLNASYLIGTLCISLSALNQIALTARTQSVEDIAFMWLLMLAVGHIFHLPRSLSSGFWVWKLNCLLGLALIMVLGGMVLAYR